MDFVRQDRELDSGLRQVLEEVRNPWVGPGLQVAPPPVNRPVFRQHLLTDPGLRRGVVRDDPFDQIEHPVPDKLLVGLGRMPREAP